MSDLSDPEDYSWACGCGEFVSGDWHCPRCGGCQPWGCGGDMHDEESDGDFGDYDPEDIGSIPIEGIYGDMM